MGWSAWQDGFDYTINVPPTALMWNPQFYFEPLVSVPGGLAELATAQADLEAGAARWFDGAVGGSAGGRPAFQFRVETGGSSGDIQASSSYEIANFDATVTTAVRPATIPPDLPGTAASIPSGAVDDRVFDDIVQYETPSCEFLSWSDGDLSSLYMNYQTDDGAGNPAFGPADPGPVAFTPPATAPFVIAKAPLQTPLTGYQYSASPVTGAGYFAGPHFVYADATEDLVDLEPNSISSHPTSAPYSNTGFVDTDVTALAPITIPASGISDESFALVLMSKYAAGTSVPATADCSPATDRGWNFAAGLGYAPGGDPLVYNEPAFDGFVLPATFRTPRWRYWIEDNVYTVGGHWAELGSTPILVKKSDGSWIPIVDGLAPPLLP